MRRAFVLFPLLALAAVTGAQEPAPRSRPVLPGLQPNGSTLLPNQWSLRPVGQQISVGDFPVCLAFHPSGKFLAVLHAGYGDHEIFILDVATRKPVSRAVLPQTFAGLCFSPDGKQLYASGGEFEVIHAFRFADGFVSDRREIAIVPPKEKFVVSGVACVGDKTLAAAGAWGQKLCFVDLADEKKSFVEFPAGSYPYLLLPDKN